LPNGNTVATNGPGQEIRELNAKGQIVWQHFTQDTLMRAVKYPWSILDPPTDTCQSDINEDGIVNVTDLLEVISEWGLANSPADINDDGIVDVTDLLTVVGSWGPCN
jgi:hypothetical protein